MLQEAELSAQADSENDLGGSSETMYYIGLDVHKKTISYCVKDAAGFVHGEGRINSTRRELDIWVRTLAQPRMIAMEATIFTGWIYDHLLSHAEKVKVVKGMTRFSEVSLRGDGRLRGKQKLVRARVAVAPTDEAERCTYPTPLSSGKSRSLISVLDFILEM